MPCEKLVWIDERGFHQSFFSASSTWSGESSSGRMTGSLPGANSTFTGMAVRPSFCKAASISGFGLGFVPLEGDDALFLHQRHDLLGVGALFVHLAGGAPLGGEVDVNRRALGEQGLDAFLGPGFPGDGGLRGRLGEDETAGGEQDR